MNIEIRVIRDGTYVGMPGLRDRARVGSGGLAGGGRGLGRNEKLRFSLSYGGFENCTYKSCYLN